MAGEVARLREDRDRPPLRMPARALPGIGRHVGQPVPAPELGSGRGNSRELAIRASAQRFRGVVEARGFERAREPCEAADKVETTLMEPSGVVTACAAERSLASLEPPAGVSPKPAHHPA